MSVLDRFMEKAVPVSESGCWIWTGGVTGSGYGAMKISGKMVSAHRVSYDLHNDEPCGEREVLHSCDNPLCVNPNHLSAGTHQENMADQVAKQRHAIGSRNHFASLDERKVSEIKRQLRMGREGKDIAAEFGVNPPTISKIKLGHTWGHVA